MARVGIVGGGAFGTAMACVVRRSGHEVVLWAREPEVAESINKEGMNRPFLPGAALLPGIRATCDLAEAAKGADFMLLAPPAQHMRAVTTQLAPHVKSGLAVVSCSKGIERGTLALMPEVLAATLPLAKHAVLSGPSFARDIAANLPAGVTLACADEALATRLCGEIGHSRFCVHPSTDVRGTALGGVMKNVIAIASGIAAGAKLGESARATLLTLGLAETVRLGLALGARRETFDGFAGAGDLMLTANSLQSRNTSLGVALGEGRRLADILASRKEVTEGAHSAQSIGALSRKLDLLMPISEAVDRIINHGAEVRPAIEQLLVDACLFDRVAA